MLRRGRVVVVLHLHLMMLRRHRHRIVRHLHLHVLRYHRRGLRCNRRGLRCHFRVSSVLGCHRHWAVRMLRRGRRVLLHRM